MRRVAVINQKGGVGKTTTAVNHGAAVARLGKSVLLLDLDPQANLTLHVDRRPEPGARTITDLLLHDAPLADLIAPTSTPGLSVVAADTSLAGVEQALADRIGRETILREALGALASVRPFDYVIMDCPPSLGVLSANALVAASEVVIPMQTEYFALQGMAKLIEVIELVRRRLNPALHVSWVLACMVDLRTKLSAEVVEEIRRHFGDVVAKTMIRMNVKLAEAPSFGRTIFEHAPDSNGAADHEAFAREFLAGRLAAASQGVAVAVPARPAAQTSTPAQTSAAAQDVAPAVPTVPAAEASTPAQTSAPSQDVAPAVPTAPAAQTPAPAQTPPAAEVAAAAQATAPRPGPSEHERELESAG